MTEEEFLETMNSVKHEKIKELDLPVLPKIRKNKEKTIPFVEQLINKHKNRKDPRLKD